MLIRGLMLAASGLLVAAAKADDSAAAQALIDEAIVAHGGEAALAKWPVVFAKTKGIFHGYEKTPVFFFTSEITNHGFEQSRYVLNGELNGQKFRITNVHDGHRGWVKMEGNVKEETREFTARELQDHRHDDYLAWVGTLLPLKKREFSLAVAGEEMVQGPAVGIRVSSPGHGDMTLYIGKKTKLLVKTETRGMAGTGVEGKVETILRLHKAFQGTQRPTMLMIQHNGRPLMSHWVLDYQLAKEPEGGTYGKP